uniref:LAGLIDADG homing endonuclease n=1 Tax=Myochromella boudieri TaxID=117066 RepID=A0A386TY35_9AGAR|nr:LAGLIDADG homing endonuclease [Myochromella boudieri]AYE93135.1 LAGLIDADG homing endonuclease [Myochromella boudieri]
MGLNNHCSAIDYMLGTIFLVYYLLFKYRYTAIIYLSKIDPSRSFNLLLNSENNNNTVSIDKTNWTNIQSAENCKGFSETIRQLSNLEVCKPSDTKTKKSVSEHVRDPLLCLPRTLDTPLPPANTNRIRLREWGTGGEQGKDSDFYQWFAGIIDGDGNFDIRKDSSLFLHNLPFSANPDAYELKSSEGQRYLSQAYAGKGSLSNDTEFGEGRECMSARFILKAIRIKLHNRDVRILTRIQNYLHIGRIRSDKNKPYSIYIVSTYDEMKYLINRLNGLIRIKVPGFKKSCAYFNIEYIEPDYNIKAFDPYFSGLIDTDGSIVFNYNSNRIECNLEFQYNDYTKKLNFDHTIPYYKPYILLRKHTNKSSRKEYKSIAFKYQTVKGMIYLYDFFIKNRLFSDFKFYRATKIKEFILIRDYNNEPKNSLEFKIYSDFLLDWIQYKNPSWLKVPFVDKIR